MTTLLAGTRTTEKPQETFGVNVPAEEFAAVSAANFIPDDRTFNSFAPVLVNTGAELVLFDTGLAGDGITAALAAAGITPDQIDVVVLTHMHGDHIGGMMTGEAPTFANARYVTGATEHNNWSMAANEGFDAKVKPLNDKFTFLDDGGAVLPGITAMAAPGHTPGHVVFHSPEAQRAFVGDVLFAGSIGRTDFPQGNHDDLIASITERLWPMGNDTVFIPGHGPESTFGRERQSNPYVGGT